VGNAGQYKSDSWVVVGEKSSTTQIIGGFTQPRPFSEAQVMLFSVDFGETDGHI